MEPSRVCPETRDRFLARRAVRPRGYARDWFPPSPTVARVRRLLEAPHLAVSAMVFPLRLSPYESYILADDRPTSPMTYFARLRFTGKIERGAIECALATALARHPLLTAVVDRSGRRPMWMPAVQRPAIEWRPLPPAGAMPACQWIDLSQEPGLRVSVLEGDADDELWMQFHHACCDGVGALRFIEDVLVAYALEQGAGTARTVLDELDPDLLAQRAGFALTAGKLLRMLPQQAVGLLGARQFLMRRPVPLTPHDPPTAPVTQFPSAATHTCDASETDAYQDAARAADVTINDLLLRDLFLAVAEFRSARGIGGADDWLRLSVPMNLRSVGDRRLSAANVVSLVFPERQSADLADPDALLRSIVEEMRLIKRKQLGLTFVLSLRACDALPGGVGRMVKADRCAATTVLSNVGLPLAKAPLPRRDGRLVAGNLTLEAMDLMTLVRPLTCIAFVVFRYAGRLNITAHWDQRVLSADDANDLMWRYGRFIRRTAETIAARASSITSVA